MFNFDQIRQLIDIVCERDLRGLEVEETGFRLKIEGRTMVVAAPVAAVTTPAAPAVAEGAAGPAMAVAGRAAHPQITPASTAAVAKEADGQHVINSPIVGTYYAAPSPDADNYVQVGDRVSKGQVLCIIEAMKLMNEIESDVAGELVEIYPKNAQPVEYGEPLFAVRVD